MDQTLIKKLVEAGMSGAEARVYVALLSRPSMSIQEIADLSEIPRSTVLIALDRFVSNGVIDEYTYGKRRNFVVSSPQMVEHYIDDKINNLALQKASLSKLVSNIKDAHFLTKSQAMQIEILKGENGFKELYQKTLELKKGEEILRISVDAKKFFFLPEFLKDYSQAKNKRGIKTRLLIPEGDMAREVKKRDYEDLRETRFLSKKLYNPDSAISIWKDSLAITAWDENLETIVVKSQQAVDIFRSMFELLWLNAKK